MCKKENVISRMCGDYVKHFNVCKSTRGFKEIVHLKIIINISAFSYSHVILNFIFYFCGR